MYNTRTAYWIRKRDVLTLAYRCWQISNMYVHLSIREMERYVKAAHTVHTTEIGLNLKEYFRTCRFYSVSIFP